MAVTEHKITQVQVTGEVQGNARNRTLLAYAVSHMVKVDDAVPSPRTVLDWFRTSGEVAWIGDGYNLGTTAEAKAKCRSITPSYIPNSGGWFSVEQSFRQSAYPDQDDISVSFTQVSVALERATFRGAINAVKTSAFLKKDRVIHLCNSAGDHLDPTIETEVDIKIIRIERTLKEYDSRTFNRYQGLVNTDEVTIDRPDLNFKEQFGPFFGRIKLLGGNVVFDDDEKPAWRQAMEIHVSPFGWRRNILDQGTHTIDWPGENGLSVGDLPRKTRIKDEDGYPITQPVPFDGNGKELNVRTSPAVFLTWSTYEEGPFMPLKGLAW